MKHKLLSDPLLNELCDQNIKQEVTKAALTSTIPLVRVQGITVITATAEAPDGVSTSSIRAQRVYHPAFIDIYKTERKHRWKNAQGTTEGVYLGCGCHCTFKERSAIDEVASVWEPWASRAELGVLRSSLLRTFVTLWTPGYTHRAAAGVHTVLPWDGSATALVLVGEVTLLSTQVWKP